MANNQSWEFYQQPDTGTKYPLQWVAGLAVGANFGANSLILVVNYIYLVPFNQMRAATLSKIGVNLRAKGGATAKLRLGIYANNASNDNYPKGLVVDAGDLDVSSTSGNVGARFITGLNTSLSADTRYWAALMTNDSTVQVAGIPQADLFFWGADTSTGALQVYTGFYLAQTYGALPATAPITGNISDLVTTVYQPGIILAFSAVT